jgi:HEAT repeat protein
LFIAAEPQTGFFLTSSQFMAKARSLEAKLATIRALRGASDSPETLAALRAALNDSLNLVVAEAATIVGDSHLADLAGDLVAAFDRFLDEPIKKDAQCRAKIAVAEALNKLEFSNEEFFRRGARYFQYEPVWGGEQDTAAPVRVASAFGLVRTRAFNLMPFLVDFLCDPEKPARIGAAQALAYSETEAAYLVLRLKARLGDKDPEVISECFNGILSLKPDEGVPLVAEFLDTPEKPIQEAAILALGDSRRKEALEILKRFWESCGDSELKDIALMALALLRLPPATDFLLELVAAGSEPHARSAISALALHRYDDRLRDRTAAAVAENGRPHVRAHFEKSFRVGG